MANEICRSALHLKWRYDVVWVILISRSHDLWMSRNDWWSGMTSRSQIPNLFCEQHKKQYQVATTWRQLKAITDFDEELKRIAEREILLTQVNTFHAMPEICHSKAMVLQVWIYSMFQKSEKMQLKLSAIWIIRYHGHYKLSGAEILQKLIIAQLVKEVFRFFMEPEGLSSCSRISLLVRILSQLNPVHILTIRFRKIHFNIILPFTPSSPKCCVPSRCSEKTFVCVSHFAHVCHFSWPFSSFLIWSYMYIIISACDTHIGYTHIYIVSMHD